MVETDFYIVLKKGNIVVSISQTNFNKKEHTYKYVKDNPTLIELIDNKNYWGTDGNMPTKQFKEIAIKIGEKTTILPKSALEGFYQPNLSSAEVYFDKSTDTIYIQTSNSDGAGGYYVVWRIVKGKYKDKLAVYGF